MKMRYLKKLRICLWLIVPLMFCVGCRDGVNQRLASIDSLMDVWPMDTLAINSGLAEVGKDIDGASERNRMYWSLLSQEYAFRRYIPLHTDSVVRKVVSYYDAQGTTQEKIRAHYLLGGVYADWNCYADAQVQFQKAISIYREDEQPACHDLMAKCFIQMGEIYSYNTSWDLAMQQYRHGMYYARLAKDSARVLDAYMKLSFCYREKGQMDSLLIYSKIVRRGFKGLGMNLRASRALLSMAYAYTTTQRYQKARECLELFERESGVVKKDGTIKPDPFNQTYYAVKARYCLATGDLDSARVYYVRLSKSKQEAYRLSGCEGLVRVYLQKNQVDSVRKYFEIFNELQAVETLQRATEQLQASHMHAEVKKAEEAAERAEADSARKKQTIFGLLALFLATVLASGMFYRRYRKRQERAASVMRRDMTNLLIAKEQAERNLKLLKSSNAEQKEAVAHLQEMLCYYEHLSNEYMMSCKSADSIGGIENILGVFRQAADSGNHIDLQSSRWDDLQAYLLFSDSKFAQQLLLWRSSLKIKERDFYICVLVRLAFSAHQIQVILRSSASTVSMARMRLLKKIFATEGGAEEFDRRLRDWGRQ